MIIEPKIRGFICTAAHPEGCFQAVKQQIDYVKNIELAAGPKNILVIGGSTGYGLATRVLGFASQANTIGVSFERPATDKRTASPGWYNTAAFEKLATQAGYYAKSINGDAFSSQVKQQTIDLIKEYMKTVDLVVYSIASPRRTDPYTGETYHSVLKPIGQSYTNKTVDPFTGLIKEVTIEPANEQEIAATIAVMGGTDWSMWIDLLLKEQLLAEGAKTIAYSYIGPKLTHPIYKEGTIGIAKDHLHQTASELNQKLTHIGGQALISVNKAVVTQASAAIPVVPLYMSLLFKVMKEQGTHEGCIEQISRLFTDRLYINGSPLVDEQGLIRIDDWEMNEEVQAKVSQLWPEVTTDNIEQLADLQGYRTDFYNLFGFGLPAIDYNQSVDPVVLIPSIEELVI